MWLPITIFAFDAKYQLTAALIQARGLILDL